MPPDARLAALLARVRRRAFGIETARAFAAAGAVAAVWLFVRGRASASGAELLVIAALAPLLALAVAAWRIARASPAAILETRTPAFRNALVTSAQLMRHELQTRPEVREMVLADTAARAAGIDLAKVLPARRPVMLAAIALLACGAALAIGLLRPRVVEASRPGRMAMSDGPMGIDRIGVEITPPAYTGRPVVRLENPERLDAIEGSRIQLRVTANDRVERMTLESAGASVDLARNGGVFTAEIAATRQTFIALTPANIVTGPRVLIPMAIAPDRPPDVRIGEPGRDLFLADPARAIPVRVTANDDYGVTSLTLAYTKVSGSGETFEFLEGTLPLAFTRASDREISGAAVIRPSALGLAAGDMLVYRAVARDAHPQRGPVESDAFVIEIVSPSEALAEGFSIDDQRDTYALSQQMVILKTERLIAGAGSMAPEAIAEEAARIAAEQRQVRAEFVFMMGGEIEDEEVEAEQSHELAAGREQNEGRRDLVGAIRAMSDAAALLLRPDPGQALTIEKRALELLQRALTRSRYILRVMAERERIEDSRRLSGDRSNVTAWRRESAAAETSRDVEVLASSLRLLSALARKDAYGADDRRVMTDIATRLLTLTDSRGVQDAAQALARASRTDGAGTIASLIDRAALDVDAAIETRSRAITPPAAHVPDRVRSALAAGARAARPGGGRR